MVIKLTSARQRIAALLIVIGVGLIVERGIASGDDAVPQRGDSADAPAPRRLDAAAGATPVAPASAVVATGNSPSATAPPSAATLRLDRLEARRVTQADSHPGAGLFAPQSWQPPKPPAPPPPPAAKPALPPPPSAAPPFPYPYIGGLSEDGVRTGFFTRGERVLALRAGDTVDAAFRIERIDETQMTLTYLPLQQAVNLVFGAVR